MFLGSVAVQPDMNLENEPFGSEHEHAWSAFVKRSERLFEVKSSDCWVDVFEPHTQRSPSSATPDSSGTNEPIKPVLSPDLHSQLIPFRYLGLCSIETSRIWTVEALQRVMRSLRGSDQSATEERQNTRYLYAKLQLIPLRVSV